MPNSISEQAHQWVKSGATLLDVRTQREFDAGHLEGAKHIPIQDLDSRLAEVGDKNVAVVAYCLSGARSAQAVSVLEKAGFQRVMNLGSITAW